MQNQKSETDRDLGASVAKGVQSLLDLIEYTTEDTGKSQNVELLQYLLEVAKQAARDLQSNGTEGSMLQEAQQTGYLSA